MSLLRISLVVLSLQLLTYQGFSQEKSDTTAKKDTVKLSVTQAQQYALENNRSILNANLDIESAKKRVWETTAIGLPQVSGKVSYSYQPTLSPILGDFEGLFGALGPQFDHVFGQPTAQRLDSLLSGLMKGFNPNDLKWSFTADITVSQLIFSGSYLVGLQSAKVYRSLSDLNLVKSKQDVLESITNSYITVLVARENKVILDSTYQNLNKTFTDMQAMGKQGFIEETDIDQMQITLSNVKTSLDFIIRQQEIAEKLLKLQLGLDLGKPLVLTDELNSLMNALSYEQLLLADFVLENNVNYQLLQAQVKSEELLLKLQKSAFLPDLAAYYQHEENFNKNGFTLNPPNVIGATLNVPIFSSGQRLARVSQAKRDLMKAQNNRDQAADGLKVEFSNDKSTLLNALDKYHSASTNLQLAKKIYNRALIKYTNGMISSTDLTTIQNQFLTAQSNYYSAIQDLVASKNKLEKLLSKN